MRSAAQIEDKHYHARDLRAVKWAVAPYLPGRHIGLAAESNVAHPAGWLAGKATLVVTAKWAYVGVKHNQGIQTKVKCELDSDMACVMPLTP